MKSKILRSGVLLLFLVAGLCVRAVARIQNPPIDGKDLTPAQQAAMGHLVWYEEPWLWLVFLLLMVLVTVATRKVRIEKKESKKKASAQEDILAH